MDFRRTIISFDRGKSSFSGWRKGVAMLVTTALGGAVGYRAVSLQYPEGFTLSDDPYTTPFIYIGMLLGVFIGNLFSRLQGNWLIWLGAWAFSFGAMWFAPLLFASENGFVKGGAVGWVGVLGFTIFHVTFLIAVNRD